MDKEVDVTPIIALGDQVQAACRESSINVIGFVILTGEGLIEYRSNLAHDSFKAVLTAATAAF